MPNLLSDNSIAMAIPSGGAGALSFSSRLHLTPPHTTVGVAFSDPSGTVRPGGSMLMLAPVSVTGFVQK